MGGWAITVATSMRSVANMWTYGVRLRARPATTIVTITSPDPDAVTVDVDRSARGIQNRLTFTSANRNAWQIALRNVSMWYISPSSNQSGGALAS